MTISVDCAIGIEGMGNRMESTGPHHFAMEGWISCAPFERLMHMKSVEALGGGGSLEQNSNIRGHIFYPCSDSCFDRIPFAFPDHHRHALLFGIVEIGKGQ